MIFIGIDPGKQGAIAQINSDTMDIYIQPIPLISAKRSRAEYDIAQIRNILLVARAMDDGEPFVMVEKQQPMPPGALGGSLANYNRGCASGWTWMLTAMGISHQLVHPKTWQKVMLAGTSDSKSHGGAFDADAGLDELTHA